MRTAKAAQQAGPTPATRLRPAVVVASVVLLAVNLRTTVASLPPLLDPIEADLHLSGAAAGVLTSLPVLCMALFAPASHRVAHRFGREASALGAVALVCLGNGLRLFGGSAPVLFGATVVAGTGIAVAGVVLPGLVKDLSTDRMGALTGAYSVAMMLGAAGAAAASVPLSHLLGSWQASLASWALPAFAAVLAWIFVTARANEPEPLAESAAGRLPWHSASAWLLVVFFSLQAALAYAYLAWLAPTFEDAGWSAAGAGTLLAVNNLAQLAAALVLPALADRVADRRPMLLAAASCSVVGTVWLTLAPLSAPWVAATVAGLGLGGGFSLALVLVVDLAADPAASSRLVAMVFLVGYLFAAVSPILMGALRDASGGFTVPFVLMSGMALGQGLVASRLGPALRGSVA